MDPERWQQVKRVLDGSQGKGAEELAAWLDEACGGDARLRARVERLLSYEDRLEAFTPAAVVGLPRPGDDAAVGQRVGPYQLNELLGRGGMGAVYRAERVEGFHQTVALKLMRAGIENPRALDRFQREREILAGLEHPNIARLLDGGADDRGRPYFAMELVDGEAIDRFCDRRRLSVRQRVELLLPVCDALQFAHRNLVLHRDLKPGNVLVDAAGTPKLLDFGIAKLMESGVAAAKISGHLMTPRYASPEHFQDLPIATASDVYSLGVLLYRLLTGRLPCGLDDCGLAQVPIAICEERPVPPSLAVAESADVGRGKEARRLTPRTVAVLRGCDPPAVERQLRGDLDAILGKALDKRPEARYASVERFADDLRRHLDGYPVAARPRSFAYRAGKYARRHRVQLTMAAAVTLIVLGFTALLLRQLDRTQMARERAERERDRAEQVSSFLVDLFRAAEPDRTRAEPSVRDLVDAGRWRLEHELEDVPEVRADLLNTLGQVYDRLGHYAAARETLDASLETLRQLHTGDHADVARALNDLAVQAFRRGDYERSERYSLECIAMRERLGLTADLIKPRSNLAAVLRLRGRLDEAAELYRQGLARRRARWGERHPNVAVSLSNLGMTRYLAGDFDAAEPLLAEALEIRFAAYGPDSASVALALGHLARLRHAQGELDRAERLYLESLEIRRRRLGPGHLQVATLEKDLAWLLIERGDLETAGVALANTLSTFYRHKPEGDPILAEAESAYGAYLAARGRRAEAEVCLRSSLATLEAIRGAGVLPSRVARRRLETLDGSN